MYEYIFVLLQLRWFILSGRGTPNFSLEPGRLAPSGCHFLCVFLMSIRTWRLHWSPTTRPLRSRSFLPRLLNVCPSFYLWCEPIFDNHIPDVHLIPGLRDETGSRGFYKPIIFPNDFWHLRSQYIEINETTPSLPLQIVLQPMSYFKFQLFASMTFGFNEAAKKQGGGSAELDEVKRMLVETNPWFLGLTGLVSILHVVYVDQSSYRLGAVITHLRFYHEASKCLRSRMMYLTGARKMS